MMTPEGIPYYYNVKTNITTWDKPEELKTDADRDKEGDWRWVPDNEEGFIMAKLSNQSPLEWTFETENFNTMKIKKKDLKDPEPVVWSQMRRLEADLVMLDALTKPLILYNLRGRFKNNEIYTNIGTILISANPYKRLPLYTPTVIETYKTRGNRKVPPHVFTLADDAFASMRDHSTGQSIVISGESGAGKTECTKQALQYIAEVAGSSSNVEQRILLANPILEAFGNAKTVRNNNSSRFGKYVEIFFDGRAQICGAANINYLLEKVRVVYQMKNERNYHAFYQMLVGSEDSTLSKLRLVRDVDKYHYLNQSGCSTVAGVDDTSDYSDVVSAMKELAFEQPEQDAVWKTLAAVLHLGECEFKETGDRKCAISNKKALSDAASLLQVDDAELNDNLTNRKMKMKGADTISIPLGKNEAEAMRDALAKFIYEKQFDWLVTRVNTSIGAGKKAGKGSVIGILDIFGFEIFEKNQFEQLCINFTNEKLQQFFNYNTFKKEEQVYKSEGIKFKHVEYIDNQPILDLIEKKPGGILPLVDEELRMPKGTDGTFCAKMLTMHSSHTNFSAVRKSAEYFIVKHYAGDVVYDSNGFLEKNKDRLTEEAYEMLARSKFQQLATYFQGEAGEATSKVTLGAKFRNQLNALMETLNATEPHYIRCIKPNPNKAPMEWSGHMCLEQLTFSGVFEACQIRKQGFPFRLTHMMFFKRYKCVMGDSKRWGNNYKQNCAELIQHMGLSTEAVQIGTTMVLYRAHEHKSMELKRNLALESVAIYCQRFLRLKLAQTLKARCNKVKPVLAAAVASRDFDKLNMALNMAAKTGFKTKEHLQAEHLKNCFLMEKKLNKEFESLVLQDPHEFFDEFKEAVKQADEYELHSPISEQVRAMYGEALAYRQQLDADAKESLSTLDKPVMESVIERAEAVRYDSPDIADVRNLLGLGEETFVKKQLQAAVKLGDNERKVRRMIKLKQIVLDNAAQSDPRMFDFKSYGKLYDGVTWADFKFVTFAREELARSMLKWSKPPIHMSLLNIENEMDSMQKPLNKRSVKLFKNILGFMGDKKAQYPDQLMQELINQCITENPKLRDEMYMQLMKQLTLNPDPESKRKGWQLMLLMLDSFAPTNEFENHVEFFLRNFANPPEKYINVLHQTLYGGNRQQAPSPEEAQQILNFSAPLRLGFDPSSEMHYNAPELPQSRGAPVQPARGSGPPMGGPSRGGPPRGGPPGGAPPGGPGGPGGPPRGGPPRGGPPRGAPAAPAAPQPAPVPKSCDTEWYYILEDQSQAGPSAAKQLKEDFVSGKTTAQQLAWNAALENWTPIGELTELFTWLQTNP